ncbi:hypothetical protein BJY04DRAFT_202490 [Aspergillus karnatakaensis]|uniref:uncharacterized protein n=1 Tax=Aspergillus karnatakaensis TaxID=1810916 RepID=UPI003CCDEEE4
MTSQRSKIRTSTPSNADDISCEKHIDMPLGDIFQLGNQSRANDYIKKLDQLFGFAGEIRRELRQQVLCIRALFFQDATVVRFIFQHPLSDASGISSFFDFRSSLIQCQCRRL